MKLRARPPEWRKGKRSPRMSGFDLIIVDEGKSEQEGPLSRILSSGDERENGLILECAAECWQRTVSTQWTIFVVTRDECIEAECAIGQYYGRRPRLRPTVSGDLGIMNKPQNVMWGYASQHPRVVEMTLYHQVVTGVRTANTS